MRHAATCKTILNERFFRLLAAMAVACALAVLAAPATRAIPPNGNVQLSIAQRRDENIAECQVQQGTTTVTDVKDSAGNLVSSTVACSGAPSGSWSCTQTSTKSDCQPALVAPTPTPLNNRAPINPVAELPDSGAQPTPLPPSLVKTIQGQATAEMTRCAQQGGTPTRIDVKASNDLQATTVRCQGGGQDGIVCVNTGAGATCQAGSGQLSRQPVLQIRNPGGATTTPTTVATRATLSLVPASTPGTTPASTSGRVGGAAGITVKPGPAKNTDFTSGISVSAWTCYGPVSGDEATLKTRCKDLHNTDFEVYGSGITNQFPIGDVRFGNLPAGQYTVRELIPNGYQLAYTFCDFVPTGAAPPQTWTPVSNVYDGYYEFALDQGQTVTCNWFNVPNQLHTPTPRPGTIINGSNAGLKPEVTTAASTPAG